MTQWRAITAPIPASFVSSVRFGILKFFVAIKKIAVAIELSNILYQTRSPASREINFPKIAVKPQSKMAMCILKYAWRILKIASNYHIILWLVIPLHYNKNLGYILHQSYLSILECHKLLPCQVDYICQCKI